jgi:hypothetical protein
MGIGDWRLRMFCRIPLDLWSCDRGTKAWQERYTEDTENSNCHGGHGEEQEVSSFPRKRESGWEC